MSFRRVACYLMVLFTVPAFATRAPAQVPGPPVLPVIVFVANGSGDSVCASDNLNYVVTESRMPVQIQTFRWSLGSGIGPDLKDRINHRIKGWCLANEVLAFRRSHPTCRVILLGHSAGTAVILTAAEFLPPDSVDRIFLMAPAVSPFYNLRPALRASREGIDVYYSSNDGVLDTWIPLCGTADGYYRVKAAGQVGFSKPAVGFEDPLLAWKFRQYAWTPELERSLNCGGHCGSIRCCFLRRYVLPLMLTPGPGFGTLPPLVVPVPAMPVSRSRLSGLPTQSR